MHIFSSYTMKCPANLCNITSVLEILGMKKVKHSIIFID